MDNANENNLDMLLQEFLNANKDKIKSVTPTNPSLKSDDEWRDESEWDKLYEDLTKK